LSTVDFVVLVNRLRRCVFPTDEISIRRFLGKSTVDILNLSHYNSFIN
jgi:hypothetical protein